MAASLIWFLQIFLTLRFKQVIPHSFDFSIQGEKTLKLWVVPFVISDNDDEKGDAVAR